VAARLPTVGGDDGNWGQILNDFLSVTHKSDGTLKDNSVTVSTILGLGAAAVMSTAQIAADNALTSRYVRHGDLVINVKDYGAVGNGTTDDTLAIQNAIDASAFGNTIYFPTGTYIVSNTIKLLKGRRYIGCNRESSTIKQANSTNLDAVIASETWLSPTATASDNPIYIENLGINGNKTNQTGGLGIGIALISFWNSLRDLEIYGTYGDGIRLTSVRQDGTDLSLAGVEIHLYRIDIRSVEGYGIHIYDTSPGSQDITDGWIVDCIIQGTGKDGIRVDTGAGWLIRGNHLYGVQKTGINVGRGDSCRVIENYIEPWGNSSTAGTYAAIALGDGLNNFLASTNPAIISNNTIFLSGSVAGGTVIYGILGIASNGATVNIVITGNALYSNGFFTGIRIGNQGSGSITSAVVTGNLVKNWATSISPSANGGILNIVGDTFRTVATSATTGFISLPGMAGTPVGTPLSTAEGIPAVINTNTNALYFYISGSWVSLNASVINSQISSVQPPILQSGEYLVTPNIGTNTLAISTLNQMYLLPVDVAISTIFSGIGSSISVVGSGAGLSVRLGYYADDGTGTKPAGAPLVDAGTFDPTVSTGDKIVSFSSNKTLSPGRYWLALVLQGTSISVNPTFVQLSIVSQNGLDSLSNVNHRVWAMSSVSGALPTIASLSRVGTNPIIGLKVA
jgi:hypothetical protein